MSDEPLISIITPAYNAERFIEATMNSVVAQTYKNWEHLVVVDQNSKDSTLAIVRSRATSDPRLKVITDTKALGAANNRNLALDCARGEFIAMLDADDLWLPEKLQKQLYFMENNQHNFSFTSYQRMSEDGKTLGVRQRIPTRVSYEDLLKNNSIACLTVMFRKAPFQDLRFQEHGWEDMAFWLQILKRTAYAYGLNEVFAFYRIVDGSRSNNKIFALKMRWNTYRLVERLSLLRSLQLFSSYAISSLYKYKSF